MVMWWCIFRQMSTLDSPTAHSNVYNMDMSVSAGISLRTHLGAPTPSNVRGSFIRQITEDFIIPLKSLTLLTKIGEGDCNWTRHTAAITSLFFVY